MSVLVLTMHTDDRHLRRALQAGARGYLVKDAEPEAILRSIAAVHDGQVIFSPDIGLHLIAASSVEPTEDRPFPSLTPREREILDRLARGLRNEAIAARMGISVKPCRTASPQSCSNSAPPTAHTQSPWLGTPASEPSP